MSNTYFKIVILILVLISFASCQPKGCPACVNSKPEYYNKEKAKAARKTARQVKRTSATGGSIDFAPIGKEKKSKKEKNNKGDNNLDGTPGL